MSDDANDPYNVNEPVSVFDDLTVKPGQYQAVVDRFADIYQPMAAERGLHHVNTWWQPPIDRPSTEGRLLIHWQYNSLGDLWAARGTEETDPRLTDFWTALAPLIVSRTRTLARNGRVEGTEANGAGPAEKPSATCPLLRSIVFIKPGTIPGDAAQQDWITTLEALAGKQAVVQSYAGFNAGSYTGREAEITWDLLGKGDDFDPRGVADQLPAGGQVDEVITLGDCIAWGSAAAALDTGAKRTILLKTRDDATVSDVETMEQVLLEWAQRLREISTWSLSRVASASGPVQWSHCFEQEFSDPAAILGAYLNHPFHWAVADRYFHPEAHQQVANVFFHSIRPIRQSLLVPLLRTMA